MGRGIRPWNECTPDANRGYREREVLGRDLSAAEVNEVRDMFRRIAALLLLEPALDENYESARQDTYPWP